MLMLHWSFVTRARDRGGGGPGSRPAPGWRFGFRSGVAWRWLMGPGDGVEVVEQGGDAAGVGLVHDRAGAAGGGDHVEAADALLDARDVARRHRQVAQPEPEQERGKARLAGHLAADADRHAAAQCRLDRELYEAQYC